MRRVLLAVAALAVVAGATVPLSMAAAVGSVPADSPTDDVVVVVPGAATTSAPPASGVSGGGSTGGGTGGGSTGGGPGAPAHPPGGPAIPEQPVPTKLRLSVAPWRIHAGESVRVRGAGYTPGEGVRIVLYPGASDRGTVTPDASGEFTATVRTSSRATPGLYTVQATGSASKRTAGGGFAIAAPVAQGSHWWGWLIAGGGVFAGAIVLIVTARLGLIGFLAIGAAR